MKHDGRLRNDRVTHLPDGGDAMAGLPGREQQTQSYRNMKGHRAIET